MRGTTKKGDARSALFGGQGTVTVWDLLGATEAKPFSAALGCELEPGGSVGIHVQQRDPEILIGLGGRGEAEVGGVVKPLNRGDLVYLAAGQPLSIQNLSKIEALEYLIIKARL